MRSTIIRALCSVAILTFVLTPSGAVGAHVDPTLVVFNQNPVVGTDVNVMAGFSGRGNVYFFVGSSKGLTTVVLEGVTVTVPIHAANHFATTPGPRARAVYSIPNNPQLVGTDLRFIAVRIANGVAQLTPWVPSGPIIADDIA